MCHGHDGSAHRGHLRARTRGEGSRRCRRFSQRPRRQRPHPRSARREARPLGALTAVGRLWRWTRSEQKATVLHRSRRCDSKILVALRFCSIFYITAKGAVRTYESGRHSTRWRGATQHRGKWIQGGVYCRSMALSRTAHTTRSARTTPLQVADVMARASGGFRPWRCRRPWTPAWGPCP